MTATMTANIPRFITLSSHTHTTQSMKQHQQQHQPLSRRRKRRPCIERIVILLLLSLAWSWIAAAVVIVYHSTANSSSSSSGSNTAALLQQPQYQGETPLLLFTCRRAEYLRQTLQDIKMYLPNDCRIGCPIIISQDGNDASVESVVHEFQNANPSIPILHYQHIPDSHLRKSPYKELAIHYKWALQKVFDRPVFDSVKEAKRVIILEEDLHLAPDFFSYFERLAPLLDNDESLLAVSAFNDNGLVGKVKDARRVLRSDFFPGLGWMMTRQLWETELSQKWPDGYWDDWLRLPAQRQGRHVLRPEVSRLVC